MRFDNKQLTIISPLSLIQKSNPDDLFEGVLFIMITGIYKITSPSKRVYIGQSIDIEKRWKEYKKLRCKEQPRIYNSFKKYGVEKHIFEIVAHCSTEELNEMERFYQDAFCSTNKNGLNCLLTKTSDRSGKLSANTCLKLSIAGRKRVQSEYTRTKIGDANRNPSNEKRLRMSLAQKGKIITMENRAKISERMKGKIMPQYVKEKIKLGNIGKTVSEKTRKKLSLASKGKIMSLETRAKLSASHKGKTKSNKIVLHLLTGVYFDSAKEAAFCFGYNIVYFYCMLNGQNKNKTNCIYA